MELKPPDIDRETAPQLHEALLAMVNLIGDSDKEAAPLLYVALKAWIV